MFPGAIDVLPATYLDQLGTIFTRFTTQDSGNFSYGVQTATARYFVKTAGDPADTRPYLDFDGRVALLRTAAELARSVTHHTMPTLYAALDATGWVEGDFYDGAMMYDFAVRRRTSWPAPPRTSCPTRQRPWPTS